MRAVVTGGAGFIGSHLADALVEHGCEVVLLDNLSTGRVENLAQAVERGARLRQLDVRDAPGVAAALASVSPDCVFHLAAQMDVRVSTREPAFDASVNVLGTINVLDAALAAGRPRVVFASTGGAVYGQLPPELLPAGEDAPTAPEAPYGQSKLTAEGYCALYARLHGLSTISLRLGNVYGPRQDPLGEAGVIGIFCGLAATGGRPRVYGDGEQTRDYVYVEDVVRACLAAAESKRTGSLNVATGAPTSVNELVDMLSSHAVGAFDPVREARRLGEIEHIHLDVARAREALGWRAEVSLADGLGRTIEFLRP